MDTVERLSKLKKLKIERHDGPLFKSPNDCIEWIDNVLPLLKYDQQYYADFYNHSQYVRITTLSADALMSHLNPMIGIVAQAVTELENGVNGDGEKAEGKTTTQSSSHKTPQGKEEKSISLVNIAEGVIVAVLAACILYLIATHFGLHLNQ